MSYVVELAGQKHTVKGTPMQPVGVLVDQVCEQLGSKFTRSSCALYNGKLKLDLDLPIRYSGLSKGVSLKLQADHPDAPQLGFQVAARTSIAPGGPLARVPEEGAAAQLDGHGLAGPSEAGPAHVAEQSVDTCAPTQDALADAEHSARSDPAPDTAGGPGRHVAVPVTADEEQAWKKRKMVVYKKACLEGDGRGKNLWEANADVPDEYYEVTAQDLQSELAAQQRKHAHAAKGLRTSKLRSEEAAQAAQAIGHATIRLLVLDTLVVEAEFGPQELVRALVDFVVGVVVSSQYKDSFELFVTPPRRKLAGRMLQQTFWEAGMVPGAIVRLAVDSEATLTLSGLLQPNVIAAESAVVPSREPRPNRSAADPTRPSAPLAGMAARGGARLTSSASASKVPKWLKMGR